MPPVCRVKAPAKLTRSLRVLGVRGDGYHLLDAEMISLDLADELEIEEGGDGFEVVDEVAWSGIGAPDGLGRPAVVPAGGDNLVQKALQSVGRRARIRLIKHIPAGAGLGGGSADAAAVLRWAGVEDLQQAAALGADVPFCLRGGRGRVGGIGDELTALAFEPVSLVLLSPDLVVSTPEVYRAWDALGGPLGECGNDLEPAALSVEPRLSWWRDLFASVAGQRPLLAGSGGTWYLEQAPSEAERLASELTAALAGHGVRASVVRARSVPAF